MGKKLNSQQVNVWLINTGWSGGEYGTGERLSLKYTRAMIGAALQGKLEHVNYETHEVFGLQMPTSCPDVPSEVLNPRNTWNNNANYDQKANKLAESFIQNFEQYTEYASDEMLENAPKIKAIS